MKDTITSTRENRQNPYPVYENIPARIRDHRLYQSWRSFILRGIKHNYDFHMTITFVHRQRDDVAIQSASHFLTVLNSNLTSKRFRQTGRWIEGVAFLERHGQANREKAGGLHLHIMGYFPDSFSEIPSLENMEELILKSIPRVTNHRGNQMLSPGTVKVTAVHLERGLMNYLSKQLNVNNLDGRILIVGRDGLTGWEPDRHHSLKTYQHQWWEKEWDQTNPVYDVHNN